MQDLHELNAELARRIDALRSPPHSDSESFATTRPLLLEALGWVLGAILLWIAVVFYL
jgi:hypothetical protein